MGDAHADLPDAADMQIGNLTPVQVPHCFLITVSLYATAKLSVMFASASAAFPEVA
jgi:hypothetical protein